MIFVPKKIAALGARLVPESGREEFRVSWFFFATYIMTGVAGPYLPLWLVSKGLDETDIGIIAAAPQLALVLVTVFAGRLADRASDWKQAIIVCALVSTLASFGLLISNGFWMILVVWTLSWLFFSLANPILDAATIRMTRRNGTEYSTIRLWGTLAFVTGALLTGALLDVYPPWIIAPLIIIFNFLRLVSSFSLPKFRARSSSSAVVKSETKLRDVLKPWFWLVLVGAAGVNASHGFLYTQATVHWEKIGIPGWAFGPLWTTGPVIEIAFMFGFAKISKRFTARDLIAVACLFAVVRWVAMAFDPPVFWLFALQLLHGFTFAIGFLGALNFVANWTPEEVAAEAQSLYTLLIAAFMSLSFFSSGFLFEQFGGKAFFAMAVLAAVSFVLVVATRFVQPPKSAS